MLAGTRPLDPQELIRSFGTIGLMRSSSPRSGLLHRVLPPRRLPPLHGGALRAHQGKLNIAVVPGRAASSPRCIGDQVGYAFGKRSARRSSSARTRGSSSSSTSSGRKSSSRSTAPRRSSWPASCPVVRTFAPIVAGVGTDARTGTFLAYNIVGGFLWAVGVTMLGYFLGDEIGADNDRQVPAADHRR